MEAASLLVAGVGGLGCRWARAAAERSEDLVDLLLVDAEPSGLASERPAHRLPLGETLSAHGTAGLPPLAAARMESMAPLVDRVLEPVELLIVLVGLGGGAGSGAAIELVRRARRAGVLVLTVAGLPFPQQVARRAVARAALAELEEASHACVQVSLERLAWQARERDTEWLDGGGWIQDLVDGLVRTLARVGLINLDLSDLRAVLAHPGASTLLVAEADIERADELWPRALEAPLASLEVGGAQGCLLQVEGGPEMTVAHLDAVGEVFTRGLDEDALVILGARTSDPLRGRLRVVAVASGVPSQASGVPTRVLG